MNSLFAPHQLPRCPLATRREGGDSLDEVRCWGSLHFVEAVHLELQVIHPRLNHLHLHPMPTTQSRLPFPRPSPASLPIIAPHRTLLPRALQTAAFHTERWWQASRGAGHRPPR